MKRDGGRSLSHTVSSTDKARHACRARTLSDGATRARTRVTDISESPEHVSLFGRQRLASADNEEPAGPLAAVRAGDVVARRGCSPSNAKTHPNSSARLQA